jgi:hypothetical protein
MPSDKHLCNETLQEEEIGMQELDLECYIQNLGPKYNE